MKGISAPLVLLLFVSLSVAIMSIQVLEPTSQISNFYVKVIVQILQTYYKDSHFPVQINRLASNFNGAIRQGDFIDEVLHSKSENPNMLFHLSNIKQRRPFFYNLIFVDDYAAFKNLTSVFINDLYDFSGLYTIVMTSEPVDLDMISKMFDLMWTLGIAYTILLNADLRVDPEVVDIYSYFPYTPGYCGVANPVLIHSVLNGHTDVADGKLFRNRFKNLHNCSLTVGTFEIKPFVIREPTEDANHPKVSGLEADLMSILSERLNFHTIYRFTPNDTQWGFLGKPNSTGLLNMIHRGEVDLGIGCISFTEDRHELLKAGTTHYTTKVVFAIPDGRLYTPLEKLLRPFQTKMWIAMALCLSLAVIAVIAIQHSDLRYYFLGPDDDDPLLNLINIVFGNAILSSPDRGSARLVLFSWIYYCFVIRSVYQSLLFQYLQQEQRWPQVETMADIDREGLNYYMADVAVRFFETTPHVLNRTIYLPRESDNLNKGIERVARGEINGVVVVPIDNIAYHNRYNASVGKVCAMKRTLLTYPVGIHYPQKSSLKKVFNKIVYKLQPTGIINRWAKSYGEYLSTNGRLQEQVGQKPLNTSHLLGCYMLYLILNGIAILVFVLEISFMNLYK